MTAKRSSTTTWTFWRDPQLQAWCTYFTISTQTINHIAETEKNSETYIWINLSYLSLSTSGHCFNFSLSFLQVKNHLQWSKPCCPCQEHPCPHWAKRAHPLNMEITTTIIIMSTRRRRRSTNTNINTNTSMRVKTKIKIETLTPLVTALLVAAPFVLRLCLTDNGISQQE